MAVAVLALAALVPAFVFLALALYLAAPRTGALTDAELAKLAIVRERVRRTPVELR